MYYTSRKDNGTFIGGKRRDSGSIKNRTYFYKSLTEAEDKCNQFDDAVIIEVNGSYKVTKG